MDTCKVLGAMLAFVTVMCLASPTLADPVWADDFEDGVIDPLLWEWGGARRGVGGFGSGSWDWSHEEIVESDGYLSTRVWGPESANTYGGEGWVRTTYDYNDGLNYTIGFTWEADPSAWHWDHYAIHITDGTIPGDNALDWLIQDDQEGWTTLYFQSEPGDTGKLHWSISIDGTNNTATLYDGPNLTGQIIGQNTLPSDQDQEWYLRFIHLDATSGGFPGGDNLLNLYDIWSVPEPASLSLLLFGGLVALTRRR